MINHFKVQGTVRDMVRSERGLVQTSKIEIAIASLEGLQLIHIDTKNNYRINLFDEYLYDKDVTSVEVVKEGKVLLVGICAMSALLLLDLDTGKTTKVQNPYDKFEYCPGYRSIQAVNPRPDLTLDANLFILRTFNYILLLDLGATTQSASKPKQKKSKPTQIHIIHKFEEPD